MIYVLATGSFQFAKQNQNSASGFLMAVSILREKHLPKSSHKLSIAGSLLSLITLSATIYAYLGDEHLDSDESRSSVCFLVSLALLYISPLLRSDDHHERRIFFAVHLCVICFNFLWMSALIFDLWWTSSYFGNLKQDFSRFNFQCFFVFGILVTMVLILIVNPAKSMFMLMFIVITLLVLDVLFLLKTGKTLLRLTKGLQSCKQIDRWEESWSCWELISIAFFAGFGHIASSFVWWSSRGPSNSFASSNPRKTSTKPFLLEQQNFSQGQLFTLFLKCWERSTKTSTN